MDKNVEDIEACLNHTASANERTGALQRLAPTEEQLKKYHKLFNAKKKK